MVESIASSVLDEAIAWHLRMANASEEDWIEFTDWLEADEAHNLAYESVLASEENWSGALVNVDFPVTAETAVSGEFDEHEVVSASSRRRWMAIAASVALVGALAWQIIPRDQSYVVETAPGETHRIALGDGGSIVLNGSTRLVLDREDARSVELTLGEATFDIVHDAANPFAVMVGDRRIVDVGTRFDVKTSASLTRVAVAEGVVRYEGLDRPVELRAGDVLTETGNKASVSSAEPGTIGGWSQGTLVYDGASYTEVAEDISRTLGQPVTAAGALSRRRFSGVLQVSSDLPTTRARVATVLDVAVDDSGGTWTLRPK